MPGSTANPYSPPSASVEPPLVAPAWGGAPYIPGGGRARAAIGFLYAMAAIEVLSAAASIYVSLLLGRSEASTFSLDELKIGDLIFSVSWGLELAGQIGCAIAFCLWFHRVYRNVTALGGTTVYTPGWAPGSFFVPILNLVRPFQIAREIWVGSLPDSVADASSGVVSLWWTLFLGERILASAASRLGGTSPGSLQTVHVVFIIADAMAVGAALVCIKMIRGIEARQADRYASLQRTERQQQAAAF